MKFSIFTFLALVGTAMAAPHPAPAPFSYDDVVLFNNEGSYSVIKDAEFQEMIKRGEMVPAAPPPTPVTPTVVDDPPPSDGGNTRRDECEKSTEVQILSDRQFLNWDVPMSPVVAAIAATATANVMQGYQISNTLTGAASTSVNLQGVLTVALEVSYARTWTSTQQINFLFQVPTGNYGIVVSEPWTRRVEGVLLSGCTDNPDRATFQSDTYSSKSYGILNWVDGIIRLCMSNTYPIPYCVGEGHHT